MLKISIYMLAYLGLILFGHTTTFAQTHPDVDEFFPKMDFGTPSLSPNGKYLAMPDYRQSRHKIMIVNLEGGLNAHEILLSNSYIGRLSGYEIGGVDWATDDRLLVDVITKEKAHLTYIKNGKKYRQTQTIAFTRLLAMDKNGYKQKMLFSNTTSKIRRRNTNLARVSNVLKLDPDHILMRAYSKNLALWKVNVHTGEAEIIEMGGLKTYDWKLNKDGTPVIRFDYTNNQRYILIKSRALGEKKWQKLDVVKHEEIAIIRPIAPSNDPTHFYITGRPEGYDRIATFLYNLKTKQHGKPISEHETLDVYQTITDNNGDYFASVYLGNEVIYDFVDPSYNNDILALNAYFENKYNVWIEEVSGNGRRWLLRVESPQDPGRYYVYDTKEKHAQYLTSLKTYPDPESLGQVEIVTYKTRDGLSLTGYLTLSSDTQAETAPLIVLPHGGPAARDYYQFDKMVQYLSSRGYQVFQPNFRGSSGFGQKFSALGHKEWGGKMQDDITDGVQHLIKNGKVQAGNICILGASYGGYAALAGAYKTPDLYKCAVAINSVSNLPSMLKSDKETFGAHSYVYGQMKETIGNPGKDAKQIRKFSPFHNANAINIPILLIHGTADQRVPVGQSREMYVKLKKLGKAVKYLELQGVNHNLYGLNPENENDEDEADEDEADEDYDYGYKKTLQEVEMFLNANLTPK